MTLQHIADHQNITFGSVKTTIMRLVKKGYVKRFMYKNGRGGWGSFEIPDPVYKELLRYEEAVKKYKKCCLQLNEKLTILH